jgi:hypothetical protein
MVYGDPSRIVLTAGYFSLTGGAAGALLGAFGAFLEGIEVPIPESKDGAVLPAKHSNGALVIDETAEDSVFRRPTALANPLIARWQFVEKLAGNEAAVRSNGNRLATNGSPTTWYGSRKADNGSHLADGLNEATESRRPLQRVRWISDDEAND